MGDATFVIVTGDMTHWGNADAYEAFAAGISGLTMPVHLMVGNHDDTGAFATAFLDTPRDPNGYVQQRFRAAGHQFLLLDTKIEGTHAGAYCEQRRAWLSEQLEAADGPVLLFMHHLPFRVGIPAMDTIMLQDAEAFFDTVAPHRQKIRHLFFGHCHRAIFGNWRGISYSCMRGLNHQVALDLTGDPQLIKGDLANPAYGVVLVDPDQVTVHLHDFADTSPKFNLLALDDSDPAAYQLGMRHEGWVEP